jgi:hypothetical protein
MPDPELQHAPPAVQARPPSRFFVVVSLGAALAVVVLSWIFTGAAPPPLGDYSVVRNEIRQLLPGESPPPDLGRYRPDSDIDWLVRPERPGDETVELRVLASSSDNRTEYLSPPFTRLESGGLRLRGRVDAVLPLPPGRWHVIVLVTAPNAALRLGELSAALSERQAVEVDPGLDLDIVAR